MTTIIKIRHRTASNKLIGFLSEFVQYIVCNDVWPAGLKAVQGKNGKDREKKGRKKYGPNYGAEVERFPGVTTFALLRAAKTEESKEVQKYL